MQAFLVGCIEKTEPRFKPSDDPFVRKLFERKLMDVGISYKVDAEGFYIPTQQDIEKMRPLSNEALSEAAHSSELEVEPGCALNKLNQYLGENNVIYTIDSSRKPYLVKTTRTDAKKFSVMEHYAGAQSNCAKN
jgi:hypothetical protein